MCKTHISYAYPSKQGCLYPCLLLCILCKNKKLENDMAQRIRQFSVVIHDVPPGSKTLVQAALHKLASKYTIALERYNHQEGYHLHVFYYLKSATTKLAQVRKWEAFKWGRVQADPMRGTFDAANVYVISADKQKYQDPSPIIFPPINDGGPQYCDCCYTTHMRYSFESHRKLISGERQLPSWETLGTALQSRLDDWFTACYCEKHKLPRRHVNDIFPQEIKMLCPSTNGRTQVYEENDHREEEVVQEETSEFGRISPRDFDSESECSSEGHSGDSE